MYENFDLYHEIRKMVYLLVKKNKVAYVLEFGNLVYKSQLRPLGSF